MMMSDEESIRMLEMRMRHQVNPSLEKCSGQAFL